MTDQCTFLQETNMLSSTDGNCMSFLFEFERCRIESWFPFLNLHCIVPFTVGIKKPVSCSHSGFSLKFARQLSLNTPSNPNSKNAPPQRALCKTWTKISLVF